MRKVVIKVIVGVVLFFVLLIGLLFGHKTVPEGYVGVKYQLGAIINTNVSTGWNWHVPFIQKIEIADIRQQEYLTDQAAYTRDIQTVERIQIKLTYSIDSSQIDYIVRNIGITNIESKLVVPQVASTLKNVISQYRAEEIMQYRSAIQEEVENQLTNSLSLNGINVASLSILEVDFDDAFERTIAEKVAAATMAQTRINETVIKEEEAKQLVIAAQAEADSAKIAAEAEAYAISVIQEQLSSSPQYTELQKILRWNGEFPQIMGDSINPFVMLEN